jgi:hypothetical protein
LSLIIFAEGIIAKRERERRRCCGTKNADATAILRRNYYEIVSC